MMFREVFITDLSDGVVEETFSEIPDSFNTIFRVTCYSDLEGSVPVNATTGELLIKVSEDSFNYGSINSDYGYGLVDLTDPDYNRPYLNGFFSSIQCTKTGITGCLSIRVVAITEGE